MNSVYGFEYNNYMDYLHISSYEINNYIFMIWFYFIIFITSVIYSFIVYNIVYNIVYLMHYLNETIKEIERVKNI